MKEYGLVVDWETTGLVDTNTPYQTLLEGAQGIEIGAILVALPKFDVLDEYSSRVKFLGSHNGVAYGGPLYEKLCWSDEAEEIHGISLQTALEAPSPADVARQLMDFVKSHVELKTRIMLCGHNPTGDMYFTKQLMFLGGRVKSLHFHYRMIDTFTLGTMLYGIKSSDELFKLVSGVTRKTHGALEDARLTLRALQKIHADISVMFEEK